MALTLEVEDTGIGISKREQSRVFEAFTQVTGQSTRKYGGTGLGLTITMRLVNMMGGTMTMESEPGVGSTFRMQFPSVAVSANAAPRTDDFKANGFPALKPSCILAADDIDLHLLLLRGYLDGTPHRLHTTVNGTELLEAAVRLCPDVILVDSTLPDMLGVEAAAKLREIPMTARTPIILLSASASLEEERLFRKASNGFLRKPFSREQLGEELALFLPSLDGAEGAGKAGPAAIGDPRRTGEAVAVRGANVLGREVTVEAAANEPASGTNGRPSLTNGNVTATGNANLAPRSARKTPGHPVLSANPSPTSIAAAAIAPVSRIMVQNPADLLNALQLLESAWQPLRDAPNIDEVENFANKLATLGEQHSWPELLKYGKDLSRQAGEFDIDNMARTLEAYPGLIREAEGFVV
jgi:CheY-like chemotaxis protein